MKIHCRRGHLKTYRNSFVDSRGHTCCLQCKVAANLRYRIRHRERVLDAQRNYYRRNELRIRAYQKEYRMLSAGSL